VSVKCEQYQYYTSLEKSTFIFQLPAKCGTRKTCQIKAEKPHSSSQASYAQNPNISTGLEKNAFLTIPPVSGI